MFGVPRKDRRTTAKSCGWKGNHETSWNCETDNDCSYLILLRGAFLRQRISFAGSRDDFWRSHFFCTLADMLVVAVALQDVLSALQMCQNLFYVILFHHVFAEVAHLRHPSSCSRWVFYLHVAMLWFIEIWRQDRMDRDSAPCGMRVYPG